eukprot:54648_1
MFRDLAKRSPNDTVSKTTFLEYFGLPGILGDRLFAVFDTEKNEVISWDEFLTGLARYNKGSLQEKIDMLFEMYDMNAEQQVNREELSLMLYTVATPTISIFTKTVSCTDSKDNTDNPINNVSDVTKQTVDKIVIDAFKHYDTNKDGLLSRQQFSNWVKQNPATLKSLDNALSKHIWSVERVTSVSAFDLKQFELADVSDKDLNINDISEISEALQNDTIPKSGILNNYKFVPRFYVIKDSFLYIFLSNTDLYTPLNVIFIKGWYISENNDHSAWQGIELTPPTIEDWKLGPENGYKKTKKIRTSLLKRKINISKQILHCKSEEDRQEWIKYLRIAANTISIETYYDIGTVLGQSHFALVKEGINKKTGTKYAIKIVDKTNIDEKQRLNLRNEIAIMRLVNHPSIIRLWDVFADKKYIYMVLQLAPYGNFFNRWKIRRQFEENIAREIIWKILDAIQYLHSLGIVHRDLKPENILCLNETDDTQIVISDFGLSKFATPQSEMT